MATTVAASMFIAFLVIASPQKAAADGAPCDASSGASCEASSDPASMLQVQVHAKRSRERKPLLIEQDLSEFHRSHYKAYDEEKSFDENAEETFNEFLASTGLDGELSDKEREWYWQRFKPYLEELLKHDNFDSTQDHAAWLQDAAKALEEEKPVVTDSLVNSLNEGDLGYTAKIQEWMEKLSKRDFKMWQGKTPATGELLQRSASEGADFQVQGLRVPDTFESAAQWPACGEVVNRIHNQGRCGSCWAFGSLSALDSRLCIKTEGAFSGAKAMLSRGQVTSCALGGNNGCGGGLSRYTYDMFAGTFGSSFPYPAGGVTGGDEGCSPYFAHGEGTDHFDSSDPAPPCPTQCAASYTARSMASDRFVFSGMTWQEIYRGNANTMTLAKESIMQNGPLPFGIYANSAMMSYSSGVFQADCNAGANHEVTAVGWGPGHISALNSWGPHWGDGGAFKVTDCGVTDFTLFDFTVGDGVPNPMIADGSPSPSPSPSPAPVTTTPAPTPAPSGDRPWSVSDGPCTVDAAGCVMSGNYPQHYSNNEACAIAVQGVSAIEVVDFSTENGFDKLWVNGNGISGGGSSIHGVVPVGSMSWASDYSVTRSGWKLCPRTEPAPTPAPTPPCQLGGL